MQTVHHTFEKTDGDLPHPGPTLDSGAVPAPRPRRRPSPSTDTTRFIDYSIHTVESLLGGRLPMLLVDHLGPGLS